MLTFFKETGRNERLFIYAKLSKFKLKKILKFWGSYVVHFICRDSPYVVHFKCRDSPYVVCFKCRDCPYVVHLNIGTVPTFSTSLNKYLTSMNGNRNNRIALSLHYSKLGLWFVAIFPQIKAALFIVVVSMRKLLVLRLKSGLHLLFDKITGY